MGVIIKQSAKGAFYSYIGAALGFLNVGLLMPKFFSTEQVGLVNLLVSISVIIGQFGTLGFQSVIVRMFPFFKDESNKHNGFLGLSMLTGLLGFVITIFLYYASKTYLIASNTEKSPLFANYVYLLLPLFFANIYYILLDSYARSLLNASIGIFLKDFLVRLLNLFGILLFYFGVLNFYEFLLYYIFAFTVPCLGIIIYLFRIGQLSLKLPRQYINKNLKKEIIQVAIYGLIAGFSGISVMHIDKAIVNHFCGLSDTGVYSTMFLFGSFIVVAGRAMMRISAPLLAQAFKDNNNEQIDDIYKKSVTNLLFISILIFLVIWTNIDNILRILSPDYAPGKYIVLFIGISQIVTMSTGVSNEIIRNSGYYKSFTYIMVIFIGLIIGLNILLIPHYGIIGAALASTISYIIFSIIRISFIKIKLGFYPYKIRHLLFIVGLLMSLGLSYMIPTQEQLILDIIIRTTIPAGTFLFYSLLLKLSPEVNLLFEQQIIKRIKRFKR